MLPLKAADGGDGQGVLVLFATPDGQFAINIEAENLKPNKQDEAYGIWLTGGAENHFLGFTTADEDGTLQASGPQEQDAPNFAEWLLENENVKVIISLETAEPGTEPGKTVLQGSLKKIRAAPTPTPTP